MKQADAIRTNPQAAQTKSDLKATLLVDCDIHIHNVPNRVAIHLPNRWRKQYESFGVRGGQPTGYIRPRAFAAMTNAWPPGGGAPGSDREFMVAQLLDSWHHTYGVINSLGMLHAAAQGGEYAAALATALNDMLVVDWLEPEPRFYASICLPMEDGDLAAKEIERMGNHPRFIQVLLNNITCAPVGNRKYWPIYEAAVHYDLPVAMHVSGSSGYPKTGCGWPSFYFEDHAGYQQAFQDQVISLITEGVFDRFPNLRFVLQEGGFSWMLPLMWRLDRSYALLREHIPALERLPSQYCRDQFWFTTQPIEEPEKPEYFMQLVEQLQMDDRYLFATDYPHWDFDSPDQSLPKSIPAGLRRKIMGENALSLYKRLPPVRQTSVA